MDYRKLYDKIILNSKSKNRIKSSENYFELHHILPKCCGGTNEKTNLVLLTAKEHFMAHLLLTKIYEGTKFEKKLKYALWMMCSKSDNQKRNISASQYATARKMWAEAQVGFRHSEATKKKMSVSRSGKDNPSKRQEVKDKISLAKKGIKLKFTPEQKLNQIKKASRTWDEKLGKENAELLKTNYSKRWNENNPMKNPVIKQKVIDKLSKPILQFTKTNEFIKEWPSQTKIFEELKISIFLCLSGKQKTAGGYIWSYKNN